MEEREFILKAASQHVYTHPSATEHWRHIVEIVALTVAALWGFYVFVYQERIKPAHEPPSVALTETLQHQPIHGGKEFVWIQLPFKNIGSADVKFLSMIVNAYGLRFSDQEQTMEQRWSFRTEITHTLQAGRPTFLATHLYRYAEAGGQSHFVDAPGVVRTPALDFALAAGKYDAVRVDVIYCFTRADNAATYPYQPRQDPDGAFDIQSLADALNNYSGVVCNREMYRVFPL